MQREQQGLFRKTAHATAWSSASFLVVRAVSMLRTMLLARLLAPEYFGQLSIALIVIESLWAFSHLGFQAAVVQRRELSGSILATAWSLLALRGLLLALICFISAPYVAAFFAVPEMVTLLHWAALVPAIQGFESMALALWQRELAFNKRAMMEAGREITVTSVSVLLAFSLLPDARAMVAGLIAGAALYAFVPYLMHPFRPKLQIDTEALKELWHFGSHLLMNGLLVFAIASLDNVIIGRLLGMEQLGFYSVAYTLAMLLTFQLVQLAQRVLFPAFSTIQDDTEKLHQSMLLALKVAVLLLSFIVLGGASFPDGIIRIIYGEGWEAAASVLATLLVAGWFRGAAQLFGAVLLARGRTAYLHRIRWLEFLLFILPIVPLVREFGIVGAAISLLLAYSISFLVMASVTARELGIHVSEYLSALAAAVAPALAAFVAVMVLDLAIVGQWDASVAKWGLLMITYLLVFALWVRCFQWELLMHLRGRLKA